VPLRMFPSAVTNSIIARTRFHIIYVPILSFTHAFFPLRTNQAGYSWAMASAAARTSPPCHGGRKAAPGAGNFTVAGLTGEDE
jgi:hypothetical protein